MNINTDKLHWIYKKLFTIRFFEERIKKIAKEKSVPGYLHTCIGSEAICVGVMSALGDDDWVSSTYRNHGHSIAKNCELKEITLNKKNKSKFMSIKLNEIYSHKKLYEKKFNVCYVLSFLKKYEKRKKSCD